MRKSSTKYSLHQLRKPQIISLIEDNNRQQYQALYSNCANVRVVQDDHSFRIESNIHQRYFNRVFYYKSHQADGVKKIQEIIQQYHNLNVPFIWFVGPWNDDDHLVAILKREGLQLSRQETGMAIDLEAHAPEFNLRRDVTIRQAQTNQELKDWLIPIVESFQYTSEISQFLAKTFQEKKILSNPSWKFYIGYLDEKPVAASRLFLQDGVAGIHHVGTLPAYRGRGLGRAMTINTLLEAVKMGYQMGVLRASSMGINIYKKIGFQPFSTYCFYTSP